MPVIPPFTAVCFLCMEVLAALGSSSLFPALGTSGTFFALSSDWFIERLAFKVRNAIGFALLRYTVSSGRRSSATTDLPPYYDLLHLFKRYF